MRWPRRAKLSARSTSCTRPACARPADPSGDARLTAAIAALLASNVRVLETVDLTGCPVRFYLGMFLNPNFSDAHSALHYGAGSRLLPKDECREDNQDACVFPCCPDGGGRWKTLVLCSCAANDDGIHILRALAGGTLEALLVGGLTLADDGAFCKSESVRAFAELIEENDGALKALLSGAARGHPHAPTQGFGFGGRKRFGCGVIGGMSGRALLEVSSRMMWSVEVYRCSGDRRIHPSHHAENPPR